MLTCKLLFHDKIFGNNSLTPIVARLFRWECPMKESFVFIGTSFIRPTGHQAIQPAAVARSYWCQAPWEAPHREGPTGTAGATLTISNLNETAALFVTGR